jgi:hypothetical protein
MCFSYGSRGKVCTTAFMRLCEKKRHKKCTDPRRKVTGCVNPLHRRNRFLSKTHEVRPIDNARTRTDTATKAAPCAEFVLRLLSRTDDAHERRRVHPVQRLNRSTLNSRLSVCSRFADSGSLDGGRGDRKTMVNRRSTCAKLGPLPSFRVRDLFASRRCQPG